MSVFPALAICFLALLWLPSPLATGDFSAAFAVPFIVIAWALLRPSARSSRGAIRGAFGRGLWIELCCISIVLIFAALSTVHSPDPMRAFRVILPMGYGLAALIVLPRLAASRARRVAYAAFAGGAIALLAGFVAAQMPATRSLVMFQYRFTGFFDNANQLSLCIIAVLPLGLALCFATRRPLAKALCLTATLIFFYALVLTGAKTALAIGFVTATLMVIYHFARNDELWKTIAKLLIAFAILLLALPATLWLISWSNPVAYEKIAKIFLRGVGEYETIQTREVLWGESWRLGMENPWLGVGAGTRVISPTNTFYVTHSHNVVLDYFRGIGVIGALAMLVFLVTAFVRGIAFYASTLRRGGKRKWLDTITAGLYLGALGYLVGNQLSDSLSPSTSFLFWAVYSAAYISSLPSPRKIRRSFVVMRPSVQWRPLRTPIPFGSQRSIELPS
jgi:O-antigen ligase